MPSPLLKQSDGAAASAADAPSETSLSPHGASGDHAAFHDPYAALRIPGFRLFTIGGVIATLGQQMQTVAIGWELYERTNAPLALGGVGLAQFLPMLLLTIPSGSIADRFNRKYVVMAAVLVLIACAVGLTVISAAHAPVWFVFACLVLSGAARGVQLPAKQALIPQLVPKSAFTNAITWGSGFFQFASMLGPALGGIVIAKYHRATPVFLINAVALGVYVFLLAFVTPRQTSPFEKKVSLDAVLAGFRFVKRTKIILAAITLDMFAVLLGGATALMPIFAKDILRVGPRGLGWMEAAPAVGAFLMTIAITHLPPIRKAGKTLLWSVAGFGVATVVFGVSRSFALSLFMLVLIGALDSVSVIIRGTLVQKLTPDEMRGRVSAVNGVFIGTSNELGGFESGVAAEFFGPTLAVAGGGVGTLLVVTCVALMWPQLRHYGRL
jgi:MFS family permease